MHQEAFDAYLKSYQLRPKPNCVYGMAVASKNMGSFSQATQYTSLYVHKFGSNERIESLISEVEEMKLEAEIIRDTQKSYGAPVRKPAAPDGKPLDDMHLFGSLYLLLLDEASRSQGYAEMEKLEARFPEAGVTLGQYYQKTDPEHGASDDVFHAGAGIVQCGGQHLCGEAQ